MEQPHSNIDQEIQQVEQEIHDQLAQRAALSSVLLGSEPISDLAKRQTRSSSTHKSLSEAWNEHSQHLIRQARRSTLATTIFSTTDPDPNAPNDGAITGIRIERYSRTAKKFLVPAYVFLLRTKAEDSSQGIQPWRVHRHTLPPSIPVHALATKFFQAPDASSEVALRQFVRAVTKETLSLLRRQESAEDLKGGLLSDVKILNGEATELRLVQSNGSTGTLRISKSGRVEKVKLQTEDAETVQLARRMGGTRNIDSLKIALR